MELLIVILVAAVLCWLAAKYLPSPVSWIVVLVIIVLALSRIGWVSL